jgi:hypothetical protein
MVEVHPALLTIYNQVMKFNVPKVNSFVIPSALIPFIRTAESSKPSGAPPPMPTTYQHPRYIRLKSDIYCLSMPIPCYSIQGLLTNRDPASYPAFDPLESTFDQHADRL